MEQVSTDETFAIGDTSHHAQKEFEKVPEGTYSATYKGMRLKSEIGTDKNGKEYPRRIMRLLFSITKGPLQSKTVSTGRHSLYNNDGRWIIKAGSDLAGMVRAITKGAPLNDSFIGTPVFVEVSWVSAKKDPNKVWDFVTNVMADPNGETVAPEAVAKPEAKATPAPAATPVPAPATAPATTPATASATTPAAAPAPAKADGVKIKTDPLDSMTDLGDYRI